MVTNEGTAPPGVLDPAQLVRIQATHRGFLYQHLYAVGCLLLAERAGAVAVLIERDEDIEVRFKDGHTYIQVKTRSEPLMPSDIESSLQRFDSIRSLHRADSGLETGSATRREGTAAFVIVANVAPGPKLKKLLVSSSWPSDVTVIWPGREGAAPPGLPPAWADIEEAFLWCASMAEAVPFTKVSPNTLVWKLAAMVQAAAAGGVGTSAPHVFETAGLPALFEQVIRALHAVPVPPDPYWPHENEPDPVRDVRVRLIAGPTGSGKTAWISAALAHDNRPHVYFSAHGSGEGTFIPALVREIAAQCAKGSSRDISSVFMPGQTGLDALRALGTMLRQHGMNPVVVVDDMQVLGAEEILRAIEVAPEFCWVLVGHPGPVADEIAARLGLSVERLNGWSLSTIAEFLYSNGTPTDALTCERVHALTGGLPLFVRNLSAQAARSDGDVAALCDRLEQRTHTERTGQEILLANTLALLGDPDRRLAELLGIAGISLQPSEVADLATAIELTQKQAMDGLRSLVSWGVARRQKEDQVRLHDAFRLLCDGSSAVLEPAEIDAVLHRLMSLLAGGIPTSNVERIGRLLELLPQVGATEQLVEIVANESEQLHELGLTPRMIATLRQVASDPSTDIDARFWCFDALAFWSMQEGRVSDALPDVEEMSRIAAESKLTERQRAALRIKKLLVAGHQGKAAQAEAIYQEILSSTKDEELIRVARYDFALALVEARQFDRAEEIAWRLALDYYQAVGLDPEWVVQKNPPEIAARLGDSPNLLDALKRLADTLDLYARTRLAQGLPYGLARIHAMKFYVVSGAYRSAVKVGQDVVDDMVGMGDIQGAREFLEQTLIPSVRELQLTAYFVQIQAQYAVILAYDGEIAAAREKMEKLLVFRQL